MDSCAPPLHVNEQLIIRQFVTIPYSDTYAAMKQFTATRRDDQADELWLLQHPAIFTRTLNTPDDHFCCAHTVPIFTTNRGGKVTYHGPGQLIVYCLINLRRRHMTIRDLVTFIESSILELLAQYHIEGHRRLKHPGIYVDDAKIASLGLRVNRGCSYHGFSLNVAMDLEPFSWIHPCGMSQLTVTQLADLGCEVSYTTLCHTLIQIMINRLPSIAT